MKGDEGRYSESRSLSCFAGIRYLIKKSTPRFKHHACVIRTVHGHQSMTTLVRQPPTDQVQHLSFWLQPDSERSRDRQVLDESQRYPPLTCPLASTTCPSLRLVHFHFCLRVHNRFKWPARQRREPPKALREDKRTKLLRLKRGRVTSTMRITTYAHQSAPSS